MSDSGPLAGVTVVELAGIGPGPFAAMLLADLGARIIRVDRPQRAASSAYERGRSNADPQLYYMHRGRESVTLDLRTAEGLDVAFRLIERADVLIEGYRPGVAEKIGLGPGPTMKRNPRLVYGRMTGWGQSGPAASTAGHDLTYLAVTGALHGLARADSAPITPPPIVGDMGGGGVFMALGVVAALVEASRSGLGQVIDAAVVDGVVALTSIIRSIHAQGRWPSPPGMNFADGGVPYYAVYETLDRGYVALAALEEPFWNEFLRILGPEADALPSRDDPDNHPLLRDRLAELFATRTKHEWADLFFLTDGCVAPVLTLEEAPLHPQLAHRDTLIKANGGFQPAPAPRFDRTQAPVPTPPPTPGQHTDDVLAWLGFDSHALAGLRDRGVVS